MLTLDIALLLRNIDKFVSIKKNILRVKDKECVLDRYIKYMCSYEYIEVLEFIREHNLFVPYYTGNHVLYAAFNNDLKVIKWLYEHCEIEEHPDYITNYLNERDDFNDEVIEYLDSKINAMVYDSLLFLGGE